MRSVVFEKYYIVYEDSRIFSLKTNKYLKATLNKSTGYHSVRLNGKSYSLHRLMLMVFKPAKNQNELQVSHLDNNKSNNALFNLEWTTPKENVQKYFKDKENGLYDNFNPRENLNDTRIKYLQREDVKERIARNKRERYANDAEFNEQAKLTARKYSEKPDVKKRRNEYSKEYSQRPEVIEKTKERRKEYSKNPEVIERRKEVAREYRKKPEVKAKAKKYREEYNKRPEVIRRKKEYNQKPEVSERRKKQMKEYSQRPDAIEKRRARMREYRKRPDVIEKRKIECLKRKEKRKK